MKWTVISLSTLFIFYAAQVANGCPQQVVELVTNIVNPTTTPAPLAPLGLWQDWGSWGSSCTPTGMQCSNIRTRDCNTTRCDGQVNNEITQNDLRACTCPPLKDCYEHYMSGKRTDDVLSITPFSTAFDVVCDQSNGGYIVIAQGIKTSTVDFRKTFSEYAGGFGPRSVSEAFWLGNEIVYQLTKPPAQPSDPANNWEAILQLTKDDSQNTVVNIPLSSFWLENSTNLFKIHFSSSSATDPLSCTYNKSPMPSSLQNLLGTAITTLQTLFQSLGDIANLLKIEVSAQFGVNGQPFQTENNYQGTLNCPQSQGYGFWFRGQFEVTGHLSINFGGLPIAIPGLPASGLPIPWNNYCSPVKFIGSDMYYHDCNTIDNPLSDIRINLAKTRLMIRKKI